MAPIKIGAYNSLWERQNQELNSRVFGAPRNYETDVSFSRRFM